MTFTTTTSVELFMYGRWNPARILTTDIKGSIPIVVAVLTDTNTEEVYRVNKEGKFVTGGKVVLREKLFYYYLPVFSNGMNGDRITHSWNSDKDYFLDSGKFSKHLIGHMKARVDKSTNILDLSTVVFEPYVSQYPQR